MLNEMKAEQWLTATEKTARYNLTDTTSRPRNLDDLLACEPDILKGMKLDYGDITGTDRLKRAVLSLYETGTTDNVTTAAGCINANQLVMDELIEPHDKVLTFVPGYAQYWEYPASLGAQAVKVKAEKDMSMDMDKVEKAARGIKLIVFSNPGNPSGTTLNREDLERLVQIARENDAWILCDEVYRGIGKDWLPAISDLYEKGISTGSLSKTFGMPGLRTGWVKGPKALIDKLNIRRDYTMISTGPLNDALAALALEQKERIVKEHNDYRNENIKILKDWLKDHKEFDAVIPRYGLVCLLKIPATNDIQWARNLFETKGVLFVPGSLFEAPGMVRLGLGVDHDVLRQGLALID